MKFAISYHNLLKRVIGLSKYESTSMTCASNRVSSCAEVLRNVIYRFMSRVNGIVENAFGIFAQTWRIYRRPMNGNVQHACKIVHATCILHNFLHTDEVVALQGRPELDQQDRATAPAGLADALRRLGASSYRQLSASCRARAQSVRALLRAGEGAVPWQTEHAVASELQSSALQVPFATYVCWRCRTWTGYIELKGRTNFGIIF